MFTLGNLVATEDFFQLLRAYSWEYLYTGEKIT
jgi:hypothetical protein